MGRFGVHRSKIAHNERGHEERCWENEQQLQESDSAHAHAVLCITKCAARANGEGFQLALMNQHGFSGSAGNGPNLRMRIRQEHVFGALILTEAEKYRLA